MSAAPQSIAQMLQSAAALQQQGQEVLRALQGMGDVEVAMSQRACVYSDNKTRLYRYAPLARAANIAPLFICYAMVNRPYLLDLQPDRSFIRELLSAGLDVYLLDWGYPDGADRFAGLSEYIDGHLRRCIEFVLHEHAIDSLNLLGVCQGGTMSLCYAALEPGHIDRLVTMVTPVDFKTPENLLSKWAQQMDVDLLTQSGNVSGDFLNFVYLSLMPFRLTQQKYVNLLRMQGDRVQLENFMRMEKWIFDSPDQPATAFREFIQWFFKENRLIRGELMLGDKPVLLQNISRPLLNIYATKDHLVPPSASAPLGAYVRSKDYRPLEVDAGHIGLYVGGKTCKSIPAAIANWLMGPRDA